METTGIIGVMLLLRPCWGTGVAFAAGSRQSLRIGG